MSKSMYKLVFPVDPTNYTVAEVGLYADMFTSKQAAVIQKSFSAVFEEVSHYIGNLRKSATDQAAKSKAEPQACKCCEKEPDPIKAPEKKKTITIKSKEDLNYSFTEGNTWAEDAEDNGWVRNDLRSIAGVSVFQLNMPGKKFVMEVYESLRRPFVRLYEDMEEVWCSPTGISHPLVIPVVTHLINEYGTFEGLEPIFVE